MLVVLSRKGPAPEPAAADAAVTPARKKKRSR
jgi:hypothetical protein